VLQNTVIVNHSKTDVMITAVDFDLMRDGQATETRHLEGLELNRAAKNGAAMQASGVMKAAPFLFCGDHAIRADVKLAGPTLGAGQAMLIFQRLLSFQEIRDTVRDGSRPSRATIHRDTRKPSYPHGLFQNRLLLSPEGGLVRGARCDTPYRPPLGRARGVRFGP
jgi:hypothetical protein